MNYEVLQKAVDLFPALNLKDEQFDMNFWRSSVGRRIHFKSKTDCGTSGCFLGWFPLLPDEIFTPIDEDIRNDGTLFFIEYGKRLLSLDNGCYEWHWLFNSDWGGDLKDAILRARYLIKNKKVPLSFDSINFNMEDYDFTNL